jgi:hypothetical protein
MTRGMLLALLLCAGSPRAEGQSWSFDDQREGEAPRGFTCAVTGQGRPGAWRLVRDTRAPSAPLALQQSDADASGGRFPHCVVSSLSATDVELSVRFEPISGRVDQAAGLVWRYRDPQNYYVVRANAREGNVVLYKVERGRRTDLPLKGEGRSYGKQADVPAGAWSELALVARGRLFAVFLNGKKLYEVEDTTFSEPGTVGIWTKADSITRFDDFKVVVAPR